MIEDSNLYDGAWPAYKRKNCARYENYKSCGTRQESRALRQASDQVAVFAAALSMFESSHDPSTTVGMTGKTKMPP
jgi:hypothetical protein